MGQAHGTTHTLSSDLIEVLALDEEFLLAICRNPNLQSIAIDATPDCRERIERDEIFVSYEKALETVSLLIPDEAEALALLQLQTLNLVCFTGIIADIQPESTRFVPLSTLVKQLEAAAASIKSVVTKQEIAEIVASLGKILKHGYNSEESEFTLFSLAEICFSKKHDDILHQFRISRYDYEESRAIQYSCAYRLMRCYVPTYLFTEPDESRLERMLVDGLTPDICRRLLSSKVLWLLCMHPNDIVKLPVSFLESKAALQDLDIIELSALWYHLPAWTDLARFAWRSRMKIHLDNLVFQEKLHGLPADLMRHHAYEDDSKEYFDPEAPLIEMIASVELAESAFTTANEDSSVKVQRRIFERSKSFKQTMSAKKAFIQQIQKSHADAMYGCDQDTNTRYTSEFANSLDDDNDVIDDDFEDISSESIDNRISDPAADSTHLLQPEQPSLSTLALPSISFSASESIDQYAQWKERSLVPFAAQSCGDALALSLLERTISSVEGEETITDNELASGESLSRGGLGEVDEARKIVGGHSSSALDDIPVLIDLASYRDDATMIKEETNEELNHKEGNECSSDSEGHVLNQCAAVEDGNERVLTNNDDDRQTQDEQNSEQEELEQHQVEQDREEKDVQSPELHEEREHIEPELVQQHDGIDRAADEGLVQQPERNEEHEQREHELVLQPESDEDHDDIEHEPDEGIAQQPGRGEEQEPEDGLNQLSKRDDDLEQIEHKLDEGLAQQQRQQEDKVNLDCLIDENSVDNDDDDDDGSVSSLGFSLPTPIDALSLSHSQSFSPVRPLPGHLLVSHGASATMSSAMDHGDSFMFSRTIDADVVDGGMSDDDLLHGLAFMHGSFMMASRTVDEDASNDKHALSMAVENTANSQVNLLATVVEGDLSDEDGDNDDDTNNNEDSHNKSANEHPDNKDDEDNDDDDDAMVVALDKLDDLHWLGSSNRENARKAPRSTKPTKATGRAQPQYFFAAAMSADCSMASIVMDADEEGDEDGDDGSYRHDNDVVVSMKEASTPVSKTRRTFHTTMRMMQDVTDAVTETNATADEFIEDLLFYQRSLAVAVVEQIDSESDKEDEERVTRTDTIKDDDVGLLDLHFGASTDFSVENPMASPAYQRSLTEKVTSSSSIDAELRELDNFLLTFGDIYGSAMGESDRVLLHATNSTKEELSVKKSDKLSRNSSRASFTAPSSSSQPKSYATRRHSLASWTKTPSQKQALLHHRSTMLRRHSVRLQSNVDNLHNLLNGQEGAGYTGGVKDPQEMTVHDYVEAFLSHQETDLLAHISTPLLEINGGRCSQQTSYQHSYVASYTASPGQRSHAVSGTASPTAAATYANHLVHHNNHRMNNHPSHNPPSSLSQIHSLSTFSPSQASPTHFDPASFSSPMKMSWSQSYLSQLQMEAMILESLLMKQAATWQDVDDYAEDGLADDVIDTAATEDHPVDASGLQSITSQEKNVHRGSDAEFAVMVRDHIQELLRAGEVDNARRMLCSLLPADQYRSNMEYRRRSEQRADDKSTSGNAAEHYIGGNFLSPVEATEMLQVLLVSSTMPDESPEAEDSPSVEEGFVLTPEAVHFLVDELGAGADVPRDDDLWELLLWYCPEYAQQK